MLRTLANLVVGFLLAAVVDFALAVTLGPWLIAFGWLPAPGSLGQLKPSDDATLSVVGATLLLALFTALLAYYAYGSVTEGRRERIVTERSIEASWRPILVDVPAGLYVDPSSPPLPAHDRGWVRLERKGKPERILLSVPFRNVGTGPAIIGSAGLKVRELNWGEANISSPILPPGELVSIRFEIPTERDDVSALVSELGKTGPDRPPLLVVVGYADQSGTNSWWTEAHVHPKDEKSWFVRQVGLYDIKGDLIVMSGPRTPDE